MKHKELFDRLEEYRPIWEFYVKSEKVGYSEVAKEFQLLPVIAANRIKFYQRHKNDKQCDWLAEESHQAVMDLSALIRLDSLKSMRESLINQFGLEPNGGLRKKFPDHISKALIKKALKRSGLNWGLINGDPCVHWGEKA